MTLLNLLLRAARNHGERPVLARGTHPLASYRELARQVARLGSGMLARFGLKPGDRVALLMANDPVYVELLFACWHAGLAAVPINAKLHPREIRYILENSGARLLFANPKLADAVAGEAKQLPELAEILRAGGPEHLRLHQFDAAPPQPGAASDLAWLFYTSGTTGRPKGAMLTHRNLLTMTLCYFADVDTISPDDAILHAAPMSHGSGLYILPHVAAGALNIIPESGGFEPAEVFDLLGHYRGISSFFAPTMVHRLVAAAEASDPDTRGLKTIVYGGGPMYLADLKRAMARFGPVFAQIYGQGESPMTITALSKREHLGDDGPAQDARLASVGKAQTAVEVIVAGADDQPLAPGESGEVLVRGDSVMPGYWQNPSASEDALRGGWLHTGDVGAMDEAGYLTLKDRSKDVIISGGSNIYPREVEEVLLRHPGIAECAVVGAPHPDWGEEVVAFVVARDGAETPDPDALDQLCLGEIARFKRPKRYRFVDALPKNNYGKVLKTELRQLAAKQT